MTQVAGAMTTGGESPMMRVSQALALSGGEAVAYALRQIEPEVVAAYPITPQTFIIERFSEYVANGDVRSEYINVESEHAALSACIGACAAGGRAATATSGPGLALMFETLYVASGMRLPIVLHLCSRALSAPLNILCDHSDAMAMREASWPMLFGANAQEAYDHALIAPLIAEHPDVKLPVATVIDGFTVTHSVERVDVLGDAPAKAFVGEYEPETWALQPGSGATFGDLDADDYYFEHKRQQIEAMERVTSVAAEMLEKFASLSGRSYRLIESYRLDDADFALVILGSTEGVVRAAIDDARAEGIKVGLLRIRLYRPFPVDAVRAALAGKQAVGVFDRAVAFGAPGNALFQDVVLATRGRGETPQVVDFVYGLGGRATPKKLMRGAIDQVAALPAGGDAPFSPIYLGLRE